MQKKLLLSTLLSLTIIMSGCQTEKTIEEVTETVNPELDYTLVPRQTEESDPSNWNIDWQIVEKGQKVDSFIREDSINFEHASLYTQVEGVTTFRGNNYRNDPTFGSADIYDETLDIMWENSIGSLGSWSGCGWSGQPLIARWDDETKELMNIYPEKKRKKGLTEVIYATLDGNIYFYDIDDGEPTRDKLRVGMTFKGTGTLDPRGYPIMYIGSGIASGGKDQRMFAINLIDTSIIYEQSGSDSDSFRYWPAFDSSPLIDAETDTLIWPGENGLLYTIKLNTEYDAENGTIDIDPENVVKARYRTQKTASGGRWEGYESSCVIVGRYLYISENSGMFFCVDLNTMELKWAQDTLDDSNASPIFEWKDDGNGYIYTAPSLRWTAQGGKGTTTLFNLDAKTGEILWEVPYECRTYSETSGGVQSSPVLGRKGTDLEGLIIFNIAFTSASNSGILVALDTETGDVVWEYEMKNYTWSSPVAVYTPDNFGYLVVCDSIGDVKLIDGVDGEFIDSVNIGSNVEASPAVFDNKLVVGTRGSKICGIEIE